MVKKLKKKSRKKPGGQNVHEGHQLKMSNTPDHKRIHDVEKCERCHESLEEAEACRYDRRQVFDIPEMMLEVTEHQAAQKECPFCGCINKATFPEEVTRPTQYGKQIKGLAVYLSQYQLLPYERLVDFINDIFGFTLSKGTVYNFNKQRYDLLEPVEENTRELLKESSILHSDETGISCDKTLQWMHVASTSLLTYYQIHSKRGKDAIDDMGIVPDYHGRVIHDFK